MVALPFALYAALSLLHDAGTFRFDLEFTLARLGGIPPGRQLANLAHNYTVLLAQYSWWALGMVGRFLLRPARLAVLALLLLLLPIAILGRTVALHGLSFYYVTPLLPFVALGVVALLSGNGRCRCLQRHRPCDAAFTRSHPAGTVRLRSALQAGALRYLWDRGIV